MRPSGPAPASIQPRLSGGGCWDLGRRPADLRLFGGSGVLVTGASFVSHQRTNGVARAGRPGPSSNRSRPLDVGACRVHPSARRRRARSESVARIGEGGDLLKCSFCGKSQKQVKKLIAGPGVYICDECIDLCNEIIEEELAESSELGPRPPAQAARDLRLPRELRRRPGHRQEVARRRRLQPLQAHPGR